MLDSTIYKFQKESQARTPFGEEYRSSNLETNFSWQIMTGNKCLNYHRLSDRFYLNAAL